jgi:hypothetical protein
MKRNLFVFFVLPWCSLCLCGLFFAHGEGKKDGPRVTVTLPLGVVPGTTTRVTVRGLKLGAATGVRFSDSKVTAKLLKAGSAPLGKDQQAAQVGDTQVEVEITLPKDAMAASFAVVTPDGETPPHSLLVETAIPVVAEKEPNNGFREAQPIQPPQVVEGSIQQPQDVDVFRFEGKAGQRLVLEVQAARHGSALDSVLTLYDAEGRELAANDDAGGSADSRLEATLPRDAVYYVSLQDAHDQGGPVYVYRLVARVK